MEMTLNLPNNYVEIEEEEMMYLDGGWIYRWAVSGLIDCALLATPIGYACAPMKFMGKVAARNLVARYAPQLASTFSWIARTFLGFGINVSTGSITNMILGNASSLSSVGGLCALVLDAADGRLNGRIGG